jgi:hypothetical protein
MNEYQKEQMDAFRMVRGHLEEMSASKRETLKALIAPYLSFRERTNRFLSNYFSNICSQSCYQNRLSACCSKDGIITFFADMVINVFHSDGMACDRIEAKLQQSNTGYKCIYLANDGCLWKIKPIVCQMFLCDQAQGKVFSENRSARDEWEVFKTRKKEFTWPDKPVLFDQIESLFLKAGHSSSLMYLHNSPGLLRVKQKAGLRFRNLKSRRNGT